MATTQPLLCDGVLYDLSHLDPIEKSFTLKASKTDKAIDITVDFLFSNHCYTESLPEGEFACCALLDQRKKKRKFSPYRYECSLEMGAILDEFVNKRCLFTGRHNWLILERIDDSGAQVSYNIYFSVDKHNTKENGLFVRVESAYVKDKQLENTPKRGGRAKRAGFAVIARARLKGRKVKPPK
jgi:hypothetical protein